MKPNTRVSPLTISFMLACYVSHHPEGIVGEHVWNSFAGTATQSALRNSGLIDENNRPTDSGRAWVDAICSTPIAASPVPPSEPVGWRWRTATGHLGQWVHWVVEPRVGVNISDEVVIGRDIEVEPLYAVPPSPPVYGEVVEALKAISSAAIDQLRNHQTQLDMDGSQVGVSRQAIEEVLETLDRILCKLEVPS